MTKLFIYALLALLLAGCESKKEPIPFEQFSSEAIALDYRKAMLNKLDTGSLVKINGKVFNVLKENNKKTLIQVNTKEVYDSFGDDDVMITFDIPLELIDGDIVQVYAQYNGTYTFKSFVGERTVPHFIGHFYKGPSGSGNFPDLRRNDQGMSTYLDSLPNSNRYEFVKKESNSENLAVFTQYESKDSRKLIFVCGGLNAFSVNAYWDLDIKSQKEAERFAAENCDQSAVLLGYTIEREYRF